MAALAALMPLARITLRVTVTVADDDNDGQQHETEEGEPPQGAQTRPAWAGQPKARKRRG